MTSQPLADDLDPQRSYGERTYHEVLAEVEAGTLKLAPGHPTPVIIDVETGQRVRGTGMPQGILPAEELRALRASKQEARDWFVARMYGLVPEDPLPRDEIFDGLKAQAIGGNAKAGEFLLTQYIGKPRETSANTTGKLLEFVVEKLRGDEGSHMRVVEVPVVATQDGQ